MGGDTNTDNPLNSGGDILLIAGDNTGTGGPIGNVSLTAGVGPSGTYGDIIFDANGAIAPIPVNSVSDPDLETTAQNIVGAINELYNNSILGPITYISADVLWSGTSVINFTSIVITPGTWLLSGTGSFNIATGIGILWLSTVSTSSTSTIQGSQRTLASINYNPAAINCVITVASNTTIYWNGMTTNGANTGLAIDVTVVGSGPALSNEPVLMAIKLSV
jgi:hypothetical protein